MTRRIHHDTRVPPIDFDTMSADAEQIERALFPDDPPCGEETGVEAHDVSPRFSPSDPHHPVSLVCSCGEWAGTVN